MQSNRLTIISSLYLKTLSLIAIAELYLRLWLGLVYLVYFTISRFGQNLPQSNLKIDIFVNIFGTRNTVTF